MCRPAAWVLNVRTPRWRRHIFQKGWDTTIESRRNHFTIFWHTSDSHRMSDGAPQGHPFSFGGGSSCSVTTFQLLHHSVTRDSCVIRWFYIRNSDNCENEGKPCRTKRWEERDSQTACQPVSFSHNSDVKEIQTCMSSPGTFIAGSSRSEFAQWT